MRPAEPRAARVAILAAAALAVACARLPRFAYDFEDAAVLDRLGWGCRTLCRVSTDHAASGTRSLEVEFHPAPADADEDHPGFTLTGFDPDWTGFRSLLLAAHNPGAVPLELRIRVDDRRDAVGDDWFWRVVRLPPGDNRLALPLSALATAGGRPLDLGGIRAVTFYLARPAETQRVFLDDLRLE